MGIFDFFFGDSDQRIDIAPDCVWMTTDAKFAGFARELERRIEETEAVAILLVAYFPDVLTRLEEIASAVNSPRPVSAVMAANLHADLASKLTLNDSALIEIHAAERHPSFAKEQAFEDFVRELPCRCRLVRHVSLDDSLMQLFAGPEVKKILESMSMPEDEAIESSMVARRIAAAQRKVDESVTGPEQHADSASEWLAKNCKPSA